MNGWMDGWMDVLLSLLKKRNAVKVYKHDMICAALLMDECNEWMDGWMVLKYNNYTAAVRGHCFTL